MKDIFERINGLRYDAASLSWEDIEQAHDSGRPVMWVVASKLIYSEEPPNKWARGYIAAHLATIARAIE